MIVIAASGGCWSKPPPTAPTNKSAAPITPVVTTSFGFTITDQLALGMVNGPPSAKVTIVEAFDFACPHCGTFDSILAQIVTEYGGKVRVVFKPYALRPPTSTDLHLGGCAAGIQGKFTAFKTALFKVRSDAGIDLTQALPSSMDEIVEAGAAIGLDTKQLTADATGARCRGVIERSHTELHARGIEFLPRHFLNGEPVEARDKEELRTAIDALLAK